MTSCCSEDGSEVRPSAESLRMLMPPLKLPYEMYSCPESSSITSGSMIARPGAPLYGLFSGPTTGAPLSVHGPARVALVATPMAEKPDGVFGAT
jgi:hypothetical protein